MINAGRLFFRPGLSEQAFVRHLILANPAISLDTLAKSKRFTTNESPGNHSDRLGCLHQRYRQYRTYRNCPDCAKSQYHSSLFDLPWISRCPVHNHFLVERCPSCGQAWRLSNRFTSDQRDGLCACPLPAEHLLINPHLDPAYQLIVTFSDLVQSLVAFAEGASLYTYDSSGKSIHMLTSRLTPDNLLFPNFAKSRSPQIEQHFPRFGVCDVRAVRLRGLLFPGYQPEASEIAAARKSAKQIEKKLFGTLQKTLAASGSPPHPLPYAEYVDLDTASAGQIALTVWQSIVESKYELGIRRCFGHHSLFEFIQPVYPELPYWIRFGSPLQSGNLAGYLDRQLRKQLYKFALQDLFVRLVSYIAYIKRISGRVTWIEANEGMSFIENPGISGLDSALFSVSGNEISVYLPMLPSLSEIPLRP